MSSLGDNPDELRTMKEWLTKETVRQIVRQKVEGALERLAEGVPRIDSKHALLVVLLENRNTHVVYAVVWGAWFERESGYSFTSPSHYHSMSPIAMYEYREGFTKPPTDFFDNTTFDHGMDYDMVEISDGYGVVVNTEGRRIDWYAQLKSGEFLKGVLPGMLDTCVDPGRMEELFDCSRQADTVLIACLKSQLVCKNAKTVADTKRAEIAVSQAKSALRKTDAPLQIARKLRKAFLLLEIANDTCRE